MGEGEPAPAPPAPVIKIFISGNSGSKEVSRDRNIHFLVRNPGSGRRPT